MPRGQWVYVGQSSDLRLRESEKQAVTAACERVIAEVYLPRYLAEIRPTELNYPIAIYGKWHSTMYRFILRYRSPFPDATAPEFEAPFSRIEFVSRDTYNLAYYRHTGRWQTIYHSLSLEEAINSLRDEPMLHPHC